MIFGVGIDIIEVERINKQISGRNKFKEKIFTSAEIAYCEPKRSKAQNYAGRFAAKEAFFKALGTGMRDGMGFRDIEITNDDLGKPAMTLSGKTAEIYKKHNLIKVHLSISHIKEYACANVTLEK